MFQATVANPNRALEVAEASLNSRTRMSRDQLLQCLGVLESDCSTENLSTISEHVIRSNGTPSVTRTNNALNNWRVVWDQRTHREVELEGSSVLLDPLPFWWLGKLFLTVYLINPPPQSCFAVLIPQGYRGSVKDRVEAQEKILGWLTGFRIKEYPATPVDMLHLACAQEESTWKQETRLPKLTRAA